MADEDIKPNGQDTPPADDKGAATGQDNKGNEASASDESGKDSQPDGDKSGEENKEKTAPKAEEKHQRKDRVQERINDITKSRRVAEADAGRLRELMKSVVGEEPPKPSDFKRPEEYTQAFMEYASKVKIPEAQLKDAESRVAQADQDYVQTLSDSWDERVEAEKAQDPDWEKTVKSAPKVRMPNETLLAIMESPHGTKIVKYLAMNPDEAHDLVTQSLSAQVRRIGYLESKVQSTAPSKDVQARENKRPNAPPDDPIKGKGGASGAKNPKDMSMAEYRKFRGLD